MPFDPSPVGQDDVLLDWYRSEANVDWQREYRASIEQAHQRRTEIELANQGIRFLKGALLQCRSRRDAFFDAHPTLWLKAYVTLEELARSAAIDAWGPPAARTVGEAALQTTRLIAAVPRPSTHRLIVLSTIQAPDAQLHLLDGYRRSSSLLRAEAKSPVPDYWAVCPELTDWDYYRQL